ncbi:MAG TPA: TonB-dependent receptor [Thermoanaerobaculia bacterium]|jgi:outer membrane receptor protein involved in Fe transport|nr:TonB-dependent receptor [Thermoanaerobaculia bacterium]
MRLRTFLLSLGCALLLALPVLSQGLPTGTLAGRVTAADGSALPGVLVTVTSSSLQGARTTTTSENGDYNIPLLPPGDYKVTFELESFLAPEREIKVSAAQNIRLDAEMAQATVSEEIVVTGTYETISTTPQAATTYEKEFVEQLPVQRNMRETVLLTPGVAATGAGAAQTRGISIAGAQSYESLFLVNGVVVNENLRGQPFDLFIEDAIEETTTSVSGVSAEYGRFSGGVVNTITKSGSNEFHGSFRDSLTNDDWISEVPAPFKRTTVIDDINDRYEATLGGWIMKDRIWYFGAARDFESVLTNTTVKTNVAYPKGTDQQRYEGKLTLSPFQGHRLVGSYIKIDEDDLGNSFGNILDTRSLNDRSLPQELTALNYNGVITENFFIEAQYSERKFTFENSGSKFTDRINGTLLVDSLTAERWWSPTFCGVCRPEKRDNENTLLKGSWFASTESMGSHDLAFGYDSFDDIRIADNHQSGSDYRIIITNTIVKGTDLFPRLVSGDIGTYIQYNPILASSKGNHFVTDSLFLNDRWRLNDNWSFNLGLRYDKNDGEDSAGNKVADDSRLSPRFGAAWDPKGDGNWVLNASYAQYVAAIASTQGNGASQGGNPAEIQWFYRGPSINPDPNAANLLTADQALAQIFAWFDQQGGVNNISNLKSVIIPGGTTKIRGNSLSSPYQDEWAVGASKRLGSRGLFRADLVHRDGHDYYISRTDTTTGRVKTATGGDADLTLIENDDSVLERVYDGLHTQIQFRPSDRLNLGGVWTWSQIRGNYDGETTANGPVSATDLQYPEYKQASWNNPRGALLNDQPQRIRVWAIYDIFDTGHHRLNVGLLQNYASGLPYGAAGRVDSRPYVKNPGYALLPSTVTYYYTGRDAYRTDDLTATDLTLNYGFTWRALGKDIEVFVEPEVLNVFNEHGVINVNTSVLDATRIARCPASDRTCSNPATVPNKNGYNYFNPFTDKPVEGVNWAKSATFGKPQTKDDDQAPRTFRLSFGFRF